MSKDEIENLFNEFLQEDNINKHIRNKNMSIVFNETHYNESGE